MSAPTRIQRRSPKGWSAPEGVLYVGPGSRWENPWRVIQDDGRWCIRDTDGRLIRFDSREEATWEAVHWYAEAIPNGWEGVAMSNEIVPGLAGHDLMCWCPLGQPCHADVLLEIANGGDAA